MTARQGGAPGRAAAVDTSLLVLAFHRVVARRERDHDLTWAAFVDFLDRVGASHDFQGELDQAPTGRKIVLSFDDATTDHARVGEELARRGLPGIFFVPTGRLGAAGYLQPEDLAELRARGHTVASHGVTHRLLDTLSPAEVAQEVESSKLELEDLLGVTVAYFAPPGGVAVAGLDAVLARAGYRASRSMRWGVYTSERDRWQIPVLPVTELTVQRGWLDAALATWRVPSVMRAVAAGRRLAPRTLRPRLRSLAHRLGGGSHVDDAQRR
jgi:peptidoglycan/xylan/chitin deacetylase (PgdA/CDA1 family)